MARNRKARKPYPPGPASMMTSAGNTPWAPPPASSNRLPVRPNIELTPLGFPAALSVFSKTPPPSDATPPPGILKAAADTASSATSDITTPTPLPPPAPAKRLSFSPNLMHVRFFFPDPSESTLLHWALPTDTEDTAEGDEEAEFDPAELRLFNKVLDAELFSPRIKPRVGPAVLMDRFPHPLRIEEEPEEEEEAEAAEAEAAEAEAAEAEDAEEAEAEEGETADDDTRAQSDGDFVEEEEEGRKRKRVGGWKVLRRK